MDVISQLVQIDDEGKLFLSGMIDNWQPILDAGIDTVIDLEGDVDHGVPTNTDQFLYIYLPIHDAEMPDLDRLHGVAKLAADLVRKGGSKVLAHCGLGLNRSALMIALIMMYLGGEPKAVVKQIRERRPGALFNEVFAEYVLTGLVRD
jgi:protein-tyrosine phosphatase